MTLDESAAIELSVVVPSFNEATRLAHSLPKVLDYLENRGTDFEIVVVDDGSSDRTSEIAEGFSERRVRALRCDRNQGKGAACRLGVSASRGRRVLLTDADLSTPIEDLATLEAAADGLPLVIGSRAVRGSRVTRRQPLYRVFMGKTFNKLIQLLAVRGIHDTQCGFKLLDGATARSLFADLVTDGFAFDVELIWLARRRGYGVAEIGVRWENSPSSRVSPLTDPPRMLRDIIRFLWLHRHEPQLLL